MKLSERTLTLLKSFSTINPSILIRKGEVISTVSPQKSIFAKAKVDEEYPVTFAIYELPRFLGVVSLFEDPDLDFQEHYVTISSGKQTVRYRYADPQSIISAPDKDIEVEPEVEFFLDVSDLNNVMKACSVMQLSDIAIVGVDGEIHVRALNNDDPSADSFSVSVGKTDKTFKMIFKPENLKLISRNYDVRITPKGIVEFDGTDVMYWIATEATSTFEGAK